MIIKCVIIFLFLQVFCVNFSSARQLFSRNLMNLPAAKISPLHFSRNSIGFLRGRRCLGTVLTLLWPQVMGPVDQGVIKESDYNEIPKTLLEYRLDLIRKKAEEEEEKRLMIRNYLKQLTEAQDEFYGYPSYRNSIEDYT